MLKSLFLAPGRLAAKLFNNDKRRHYRSARMRPVNVGMGTVFVSLLFWMALAGGGYMAVSTPTETGSSGPATSGQAQDPPDLPGESGGPLTEGGRVTAGNSTAGAGSSAGGAVNNSVSTPAPVVTQQWLVILHTIPKSGRDARNEAERKQIQYRNRGLEVEILDTDSYPKLRAGSWIIALGPFDNKDTALTASNIARTFQSDLMVRQAF